MLCASRQSASVHVTVTDCLNGAFALASIGPLFGAPASDTIRPFVSAL